MFRQLNFAVAWLLLAVPATCAADLYLDSRDVIGSEFYTGTSGEAAVSPLSGSDWLAIHADDAAELGIRDFGFIVEDDAVDGLVYGIANRLLAAWPGTVPRLAIFIQGDRSPYMYSALTTHAREIFIDYGVLVHAETTDELAAVIGHELSHVLLGHVDAIRMKKSVIDSLSALNEANDLYSKADALRFNSETGEVSVDSTLAADLDESASKRILAERLYDRVHASLFSRGAEHDADRLAMDLMVAAGYSPMGLKISLERMAHSHDLSTAIAEYFAESSQSLLNQSISLLDRQLNQKQFRPTDFRQFVSNFQDEITESTIDFAEEAAWTFTAKSHPVPDKRVEQIIDYLYENYPRSARRRQPDRSSGELFRQGHIGAVINHYVATNLAREAAAEGEFASVEGDSTDAGVPPVVDEPYLPYVSFVSSRSKGARPEAVAAIRKMPQESLIPVHATIELTNFLADSGRGNEANVMMDRYERYYGPIKGYYPPRIKLAAAAEDRAGVASLARACFDSVPPESPLSRQCAAASGLDPAAVDVEEEKQPGIFKSANKLKKLFSN